jgi:phosphatidylinositol glycan class W
VIVRSVKTNPLLEYILTVLPLLLATTVLASHTNAFNVVILGLAGMLSQLHREVPRTQTHNGKTTQTSAKRTMGKWLDESDSDEEVAETVQSTSPSLQLNHRRLPSEVLSSLRGNSASRTGSRSPSPAPMPSPVEASLSPNVNGPTHRTWKRRHSPTPSTYTHTAINILPTPELLGTHALSGGSGSYPSPSSRSFDRKVTVPRGTRLGFLSVYRAQMMVMTVICILAVDFPVFPRWQGKCEDFGTSLVSRLILNGAYN